MNAILRIIMTATVLAALTGHGPLNARTLRVADQGDAVSMDPHSLNDGLQLSLTGNIYEGLTARGRKLELVPALARRWQAVSPTVWRFDLRTDVRFHDGSAFTADDVLFSIERARAEGSDMRAYVGLISTVRATGAHTVEIETSAPAPILPEMLSLVYIMSHEWSKANAATRPVDKRKGIENAASYRANGTGPYRLKSRDPGVKTVLVQNPAYWGDVPGNVDRVEFTPIANDATRVAALVSGEIDMMQPVPVRDIPRLSRNEALVIRQGPELRTIFLNMDQSHDELPDTDIRGRNPFKDIRVRKAFYQAIDIEAIRRRIMRGASRPSALLLATGVNGYSAALDQRLPYDPEAARALLAQAGFADGFKLRLDCPNDRYVNDAEICQAITSMLARIGIRISLQTETKATYFPRVLARKSSFHMLGWTPSTYDAHNVLFNLIATPGPNGRGQFNLGGYSNPEIDRLTIAIAAETDINKRMAMITEALRVHRDEIGHLPLHQQALAWGMRRNVQLVQSPDNFNHFKWAVIR